MKRLMVGLLAVGLFGQVPKGSGGGGGGSSSGGTGGVYCNATGGATNTLICTGSPVPTSYTAGMTVSLKVDANTTGAATLNISSLGAKNIYSAGAPLASGALSVGTGTGNVYNLAYDGTQFNIVSVGPTGPQGTVGVVQALKTANYTVTSTDCGSTIPFSGTGLTVSLPANANTSLGGTNCTLGIMNQSQTQTLAVGLNGATANGQAAYGPIAACGATAGCPRFLVQVAPDGVNYYISQSGATGPAGPAGSGYGGTSTTSFLIGTGSKAFTTQAGLAYTVGAFVRASSAANGANYMQGLVTAYSSTTLTVNVTEVGGSGTLADWNFNTVGNTGASGASNPGGISGQIQYNNGGAFGGYTQSGDCTTNTATGVITCTKINGGSLVRQYGATFANSGSAISTGISSGASTSPVAGTITAWNICLTATDAGTATVKFLKIGAGTAAPGSGNSINTSGVSISTGTCIRSTTLSDFTTTAVSAGDKFSAQITAVAGTITGLTATVEVTQ